MTLPIEDLEPEAPSGELVHWMGRERLRLEPAGVSLAALGAFALGAAAAFGLVAAGRWLGPRREGLPPWKWGRGPLH